MCPACAGGGLCASSPSPPFPPRGSFTAFDGICLNVRSKTYCRQTAVSPAQGFQLISHKFRFLDNVMVLVPAVVAGCWGAKTTHALSLPLSGGCARPRYALRAGTPICCEVGSARPRSENSHLPCRVHLILLLSMAGWVGKNQTKKPHQPRETNGGSSLSVLWLGSKSSTLFRENCVNGFHSLSHNSHFSMLWVFFKKKPKL